MSKYKMYSTPSKTTRLKTDYFIGQDSSRIKESQCPTTARQRTHSSYYDISIQKSKVSQRQGYLSKRKREVSGRQESISRPQKKRCLVFKNMGQFEVELKTQNGKLNKVQPLNSFAIMTYRGVNKNVNSHQIGAHIGQLTALTLIQGYDGLFAASELKKHFNNELLLGLKQKQSNSRQEPFHQTESCIRKALQHSKKRLKKQQEERGDNSGASFLTLVAHKDIIFAINCGSSQALCMTKNGKLIKLAQSHTTHNEQEVERIVKEGGQLYQTIVNVPYQKQIKVRGPLRVFPDGLTVTRTLGKSLSSSRRQKIQTVSGTISIQKGIISEPQLQFIPASQIRWVVLLSSKIIQNVSSQRIRDLIEQGLVTILQGEQETQTTQYCCKRLILQAVELGATDSLSAMLILGQIQMPSPPKQVPSGSLIKKKQTVRLTPSANEKLIHQPRSLKYIGNRPNFVQLQ